MAAAPSLQSHQERTRTKKLLVGLGVDRVQRRVHRLVHRVVARTRRGVVDLAQFHQRRLRPVLPADVLVVADERRGLRNEVGLENLTLVLE